MGIAADVATASKNITDELDDMTDSDVAVVMCGSTWLRCHLKSCTASRPGRPVGGGLAAQEFDFVFDYDN
jgi:hypothetical protein